MKLENIERFVLANWQLDVHPFDGKFHATVYHTKYTSHNYIGRDIPEALAGLDNYVSDLPENGDGRRAPRTSDE